MTNQLGEVKQKSQCLFIPASIHRPETPSPSAKSHIRRVYRQTACGNFCLYTKKNGGGSMPTAVFYFIPCGSDICVHLTGRHEALPLHFLCVHRRIAFVFHPRSSAFICGSMFIPTNNRLYSSTSGSRSFFCAARAKTTPGVSDLRARAKTPYPPGALCVSRSL